MLTGLAARRAAQNIGIGIGNLRALFLAAAAPLVEARSSPELDRILDERARYYQTMAEIAGNEELNRAMPLSRAHMLRAQFHSYHSKADLRAMVLEYRQISEAILAGDAQKAELYTRRRVRRSAQRTLPHLR